MGTIYGDFLNRDDYVDKIVSVIKECANKTAPTTFSIEGEWGQGKTWLIHKVEASLKGLDISKEYSIEQYENARSDYFIIHYNAWEKDYYDEPLLAILSTVVTELNKQLVVNNILQSLGKKIGRELLKQLENVLSTISQKIFKFDVIAIGKQTAKAIKKVREESDVKLISENSNKDIDSDIKNLIEILNKLSKEIPIVFVVDELDRCVPIFAVKTLERLHHIFYHVNKSVTVLSISKEQLDRSINQLYGQGSSIHYFRKFIDFRIMLNSGKADADGIQAKLNEFSKLFNPAPMDTRGKELLGNICEELLPREFENVINRAMLCHRLIEEDTSMFPYECLIAEIIVQTYWNIAEREKNSHNISPDNGNRTETALGTELKNYFKELRSSPNLSFDGDGVIACIVSNVLNYKYNFGCMVGDEVILFSKVTDYYKKYAVYFKIVRIP